MVSSINVEYLLDSAHNLNLALLFISSTALLPVDDRKGFEDRVKLRHTSPNTPTLDRQIRPAR